jgi:renalase
VTFAPQFPSDATSRVAVIGAGLAGLACATTLREAGIPVQVFDKSRGPSGRMSTRRGDGWQCDHGAQYFTARDPGFRAEVDRWVQAGAAAVWAPRLAVLGPRPDVPEVGGETRRWVGTPRMTSPAGWLAAPLQADGALHLSHTVIELARTPAGRWRLHTQEHGLWADEFDAVLLAVPAPQALPLMAPHSEPLHALSSQARMRGSWALMLCHEQPVPIDFEAAFINEGPLRWVAKDSSKPGRPAGETWLLHASAEWSEQHLEESAEAVTAWLLAAWQGWLAQAGAPAVVPTHCVAHRWRYADTDPPLKVTSAWDASTRLGLCGDWLAEGKVEGAWLSGRDLAAHFLGA